MFSVDFAAFRGSLGASSGFQSVQFRKLEYFCGKKNPAMLKLVGEDHAAKSEMATFLDRATPYDHFIRHLAREDNNVFQVPRDVLERDTSKPHELDERLVTALELLYRKQAESHKGERYYAQFRVAEHLLEFDEKFSIWRFHHVKMVERMIGGMKGTGGSAGAGYLRSTLEPAFFPDIWAVRNRLGGGGGAQAYAGGPTGASAGEQRPAGGGCPMGH
jgi:tryptophan 2,3-dioxygenase